MATTVVTLTQGAYSYENEAINVSGGLAISSNKVIMGITGPVTENNVQIGSFSAQRDMSESLDDLRFNVSFTDPTKAATLVQAAQDAVAAVQAELNK